MKQERKLTIIAGENVNQTIDRLFRDRSQLESLLAIGRNGNGDIYFYDTGGDIIQDLGVLEYIKDNVRRSNPAKPNH